MAVYPQSVKIYAELQSVWTDITSDVLASERVLGSWGMRTNRELDRVATPGKMTFALDNSAGLYAPNLGTARAGWGKGTPVKLVITFRDIEYIKFRGTVDSLNITGGALGLRRVYVTVKDWLDFADKYPLVNPGIQTNKRADQVLTTIVSGMPIQPQETSYEEGTEVFPTVLDAATTKTRATSEFNKLALSEMGYIYLRKDKDNGEQLTFEASTHRKGTDTATTYDVSAVDDGFLLLETGDYLLTETGDKFILEASETISLTVDNNMQDVGVEYGNNLINRMTTISYPRRVDTSLSVLFSLGFPMQIGAGETIEFRSSYIDPSGDAIVNAISDTMVDPVITTDYLMNTVSDGSGTNTTSDLVITATYGTEGVTYVLKNNNANTCYITKLQARGYGVYTFATLETTVEDQTSIDAYGYHSETLHQMYQQNTVLGKSVSGRIVGIEKDPRTVLNSLSINANKHSTSDYMFGFLLYDIGDLVPVSEDATGIDSQYYIQGVSFSIEAGPNASGIIDYRWILKEQQSMLNGGRTSVAVDFSSKPSGTLSNVPGNSVTFGCLEYINSATKRTYSFWIIFADDTKKTASVMGAGNDAVDGVWLISIEGPSPISADKLGRINFFQYDGSWFALTGITGTGGPHHFLVTKDTSSLNTAPIIYVDGASVSVTTSNPQSVLESETGLNLRLGGRLSSGGAIVGTKDARVRDVRIWNRVLTAAEALEVYDAGIDGTAVQGGLCFQGPVVDTRDLTYYTNHTMVDGDKLIDNVFSQIGVAEWDPAEVTAPIVRL